MYISQGSLFSTKTLVAWVAIGTGRASISNLVHGGPPHVATNRVVADEESPPPSLVLGQLTQSSTCGQVTNDDYLVVIETASHFLSVSPHNLRIVTRLIVEPINRNRTGCHCHRYTTGNSVLRERGNAGWIKDTHFTVPSLDTILQIWHQLINIIFTQFYIQHSVLNLIKRLLHATSHVGVLPNISSIKLVPLRKVC